MAHLMAYESAGQGYEMVTAGQIEYKHGVTQLTCVSKSFLDHALSMVVSAVGKEPLYSLTVLQSKDKSEFLTTKKSDAPLGRDACPVGLNLTVRFGPEDGLTYWTGSDRYKFTGSGLVDALVKWLDEGNEGSYLDFLVHAGLVGQVATGRARDLRGQHSGFFSSARDAGIISHRQEGRRMIVVPGRNYQALKSGGLRYTRWDDGGRWLALRLLFLEDDWITLRADWTQKPEDPGDRVLTGRYHRWMTCYRCDGLRGLEMAMGHVMMEGEFLARRWK